MKRILLNSLLCTFTMVGAYCAELQKTGDTVDYVLSALPKEHVGLTCGGTRSVQLCSLHGGYQYTSIHKNLSDEVIAVKEAVKGALDLDGGVLDCAWSGSPANVPALIIASATKQKEHILLTIWVFPPKDGKIGVSYTQENSKL